MLLTDQVRKLRGLVLPGVALAVAAIAFLVLASGAWA